MAPCSSLVVNYSTDAQQDASEDIEDEEDDEEDEEEEEQGGSFFSSSHALHGLVICHPYNCLYRKEKHLPNAPGS